MSEFTPTVTISLVEFDLMRKKELALHHELNGLKIAVEEITHKTPAEILAAYRKREEEESIRRLDEMRLGRR